MADDLVAMTEAIVPGGFVLVAHSMGGLVARRAAERLGPRLRGLLLVGLATEFRRHEEAEQPQPMGV